MLGISLKYRYATCIPRLFLLYRPKPNPDFNSAKSLSVGDKTKKVCHKYTTVYLWKWKVKHFWKVSVFFHTHTTHLNNLAFFQFPYGRVCSCLSKKPKNNRRKLDSDANIKAPKNKPAIVASETGWVMKTSIQRNYPGSVKNSTVI